MITSEVRRKSAVAVFALLFSLIGWRLYDIQIVHGETYTALMKNITRKTELTEAPRGRIFDCNKEVLADNRSVYYAAAVIQNLPEKNREINEIIYKMITLLGDEKNRLVRPVPVAYQQGGYVYTDSQEKVIAFKKNLFTPDGQTALTAGEEEMTADGLMKVLCQQYFDIEGYTEEDTCDIVSVRYQLYLKRFYPCEPVKLTSGLSVEAVACISEHLYEMPGIELTETLERYYPDSRYFSNITGYTGLVTEELISQEPVSEKTISEEFISEKNISEELISEELISEEKRYSAQDMIGKTGIEKSFEDELRGTKGVTEYTTSYSGEILDSKLVKKAQAGNDIYLTIDKSLQMYLYDLLEERAAGIILAKFVENADLYKGIDGLHDTEEIIRSLTEQKIIDISNEAEPLDDIQILKLLYTQKVLPVDEDYERLCRGEVTAYEFLYGKIKSLALPPDMLGISPCSAVCIVTEASTGKVRACVSYPGFDVNRISENTYFSSLLEKASRPLFNRAAQMTMAPGSVFKMITAAAVLEEGIMTPTEKIYDATVFHGITPGPSCWSDTSHGWLDISEALTDSCNYFFYQAAYWLSQTEGRYSSDKGLAVMRKYAEDFGMSEFSGLELEETPSRISDENAVLSAIGQGTHNYTPAVIARYVTALASKGRVYRLSLLDHIIDSGQYRRRDSEPEVLHRLNLSERTWQAIYKGMADVCSDQNYGDVFSSLPVRCAGKSGTAQTGADQPDHSLFAGFVPLDDPQYAVTVIIPSGGSSANAVDIFRDAAAACMHMPLYNRKQSADERQALMPYMFTNQEEYLKSVSEDE